MLPADLSALTPAHLDRLVDDRVAESAIVEFKLQLPDWSDKATREFLADATAFANANGGHLVYGVEETDGVATSLPGIDVASEDQLRKEIENRLWHGIEPRLTGIDIRLVSIASGKVVVVIRIPRSWNAPHRVIFLKHAYFYVRDTQGRHSMSVDELRTAFNLSTGLVDRIRDFREQRIELVLHRNAGPVPLEGPPSLTLLLHLVPLTAFASSALINIDREQTLLRNTAPVNPRAFGHSSTVTLDGHVNYLGAKERGGQPGYVLFFRNGIVEHAACFVAQANQRRVASGPVVEAHIEEAVRRYLDAQRQLAITPPIYALLSLHGAMDTKLFLRSPTEYIDTGADRDEINLPEAVIDDFGGDLAALLAPTFAIMWNAFGRHRPG